MQAIFSAILFTLALFATVAFGAPIPGNIGDAIVIEYAVDNSNVNNVASSVVAEATPAPTQPSYDSGSSLQSSGRPFWGVTYSPYNPGGSCSDASTVASQLGKVSAIAGNVRLYSTDCSQLSHTLQAITTNNLNLDVHAGIWVSDGDARMESDLEEFVSTAKQYASSGLIKGVSVGNEDLFKGMSESQLIGYINKVRSRLQSEGLGNIAVYTTDTDAKFTSNVAQVCDLIQVNTYAIFDSAYTSIENSVQSIIDRVNKVKSIAGGKPVRIGESGWSTSGASGVVPVSHSAGQDYAHTFKCAADKAGLEYFYFEAKDATWKQGASALEQNFGLFDASFTPKYDFNSFGNC